MSHQFQILGMGDKSERAQKIFALDYCAGAFVTEGEHCSSPPSFGVVSLRASQPGGCCPLQICVPLQAGKLRAKIFLAMVRGWLWPCSCLHENEATCDQADRAEIQRASHIARTRSHWLMRIPVRPCYCDHCACLPGEVKYCVAKLFSNDVKFANVTDY